MIFCRLTFEIRSSFSLEERAIAYHVTSVIMVCEYVTRRGVEFLALWRYMCSPMSELCLTLPNVILLSIISVDFSLETFQSTLYF